MQFYKKATTDTKLIYSTKSHVKAKRKEQFPSKSFVTLEQTNSMDWF